MRILLVLAIAVATTRLGHADDVLPSLVLQADTAGQGAKLKGGFDYRLRSPADSINGRPFRLIVSPFLQATTNQGLTALLAIDSDGPSASSTWEVGGVISYLDWPKVDQTSSQRGYQSLERSQYEICRAYCGDPIVEAAKPFCEVRKKYKAMLEAEALQQRSDGLVLDPVLTGALREREIAKRQASEARDRRAPDPALDAREQTTSGTADRLLDEKIRELVSATEYCPQAKAALHAYELDRYDPWSTVPTSILAVGISGGATVDKYLQPQGLGMTSEKETHSMQTLAFLLVKQMRGLSFELPVIAKRRFELATTRSAKWCKPAGMVVGSDGAAAAEECDERPIGPLDRRYSIQLGALFGRFSPRSFWRVSGGPVLSLSSRASGDTATPYKLGLVIPFHIATELLKKDSKTLARFSVGVFRARGGNGAYDNSISFTLAILGSSTLFASPFDQF